MQSSHIEWLAERPGERDRLLRSLGPVASEALAHDWGAVARPGQVAPPGDWRIWLMMAGRGFGKTRAVAEWVRGIAEADPGARIAVCLPLGCGQARLGIDAPVKHEYADEGMQHALCHRP